MKLWHRPSPTRAPHQLRVGGGWRFWCSGFTLLELLVVISVLGLLAALALPVLNKVKTTALSASCKSNLHQLGLALNMYLSDQNCYPLYQFSDGTQLRFWPSVLGPALAQVGENDPIKSRSKPFQCPSGTRKPGILQLEPMRYGYSDEGFAFQGLGSKLECVKGEWRTTAVRESDVMAPVSTIALADGIARLRDGSLITAGISLERWRLSSPALVGGMSASVASVFTEDRFVRALHARQANVSFCDGHVEANALRRLFDETGDEALSRWNRDQEAHREWLSP